MGRNRFVGPDVDRLQLSDGDWVDVRRRLNVTGHRSMLAKTYTSAAGVDGLKLDVSQVGLSRVVAYVLGWSFVDGNGKPVECSESAIGNLDTDSFKEILDAVDAHIEAQESARAAEKNAPTGETTSRPTSPSAAL